MVDIDPNLYADRHEDPNGHHLADRDADTHRLGDGNRHADLHGDAHAHSVADPFADAGGPAFVGWRRRWFLRRWWFVRWGRIDGQ